jgi:hypothetical protein
LPYFHFWRAHHTVLLPHSSPLRPQTNITQALLLMKVTPTAAR